MTTEPLDFDKRVDQYVKLRDKISELDTAHKEKMAPYRETLEQLNNLLLNQLNQVGGDSIKTQHGTVYRTAKKSATLADKSAFWGYVVGNDAYHLIDYKANAAEVAKVIDEGVVVPGVNFSVTHVVGVRRK